MALWQWSKTATSNATADPTINFAEGQPPSTVNDSARALMARVAEWRDDVGGNITTGGTASAYTLTTNEGLQTPTPATNQLIGFNASVTNNASATLAVDGGSAFPIQTPAGTAIGAGVLVASGAYAAVFNGTAWVLRNFFGGPASLIPLGGILPYTGASAPNANFVFPFGQQISQTTYATLYALYGANRYGADGGGNFFLPDLRGRSIFGLDNMGGSAASRITVAGGNFDGTVIGGSGGGQNQTLTVAQLPAAPPSGTWTFTGNSQSPALNTTVYTTTAAGNTFAAPGAFSQSAANPTITFTPTGTITNGNLGSGNSHTILSPAMTLPFILRII